MPRTRHPPQSNRGFIHATIPGLVPIVHSALECSNIAPSRARHLTASSLWMLIYFFDPTHITIERPGARPMLCDRHTALLITPGTRYTVDTRAGKQLSRHIWMTMDGIQLTPIFSMMAPSRQGCLLFDDPEKILAPQMESLIETSIQSAPYYFWPAHLHGRRILDILQAAEPVSLMTYRVSQTVTSPPVDRIVGQVVQYLQAHLGDKISLSELARHLHMSASTVSHRYRAAAGESPMQTLNRLRLLQTKIRLVQGETVESIAHDLGFYDAKHLSNTFRKAEGIPPRVFVRGTKPTPTPN